MREFFKKNNRFNLFAEGLNALHDLDHVNGANEMNALLSLVLSMGQNRVAGALRFDSIDSPSDSSADEGDAVEVGDAGDGDDGDDGDDHPDRPSCPDVQTATQSTHRPESSSHADTSAQPSAQTSAESSGQSSAQPEVPGPSSERRSRTTQTSSSRTPRIPDKLLQQEWIPQSIERDQFASSDSDDIPEFEEYHKLPHSCRGLLTFEFQDDRRVSTRNTGLGGPSTSSDDRSSTDTETRKGHDTMGVPAEVEIYLGKEGPSTSRDMDWEGSLTEQKDVSTSEDETTETSKELKRKKLDSGIGEGTTTSSGSSPVKSESVGDTSDGDLGRSDNLSEDDNTNCKLPRHLNCH